MANQSIHDHITQTIIAAIEAGAGDWQMPWHRPRKTRPLNAKTGKPYSGINVLRLWIAGMGHASSYWATYKQWQALGGQVRKGEKSARIAIYRPITTDNAAQTAIVDDAAKPIRAYAGTAHLFNACQLEAYDAWLGEDTLPLDKRNSVAVIARAEQFVAATGAVIEIGGMQAAYHNTSQTISMPDKVRFIAANDSSATQNWYSTLLHELVHWTRHESRCDRSPSKTKRDYAFEELVAEIGSAYLCADLGVELTPRPDHAAYIQNWLDVLNNDNRAIFQAAALAEKAVQYLHNLQPQEQAA